MKERNSDKENISKFSNLIDGVIMTSSTQDSISLIIIQLCVFLRLIHQMVCDCCTVL